MKSLFTASAALLALAAPALAAGDAAEGEKEFRKCKACHMIQADDGEMIVRGGRTGPNLYGVIGRTAGSVEDFKYGDSLVAAGEAGLVWDEENMVPYLEDPKAFLVEQTGDSGARSLMTFRLRKGGEDVAAYLASLTAE